MLDILSVMKICSICKLPQENFYKNSNRPDGLQTYCKECSIARSKKRYQNFSDEQKLEMQNRAKQKSLQNKQFLWDFLKEHPCVDCGEIDPIVLEFDHLSDKKGCLSTLAGQGLGLETIKQEVNKCEVRCANCHRKKTATQFGWYKDIIK